MDIYNSSEEITNGIIEYTEDYLKKYSKEINDGDTWSFSFNMPVSNIFKNKTRIKKNKIDINYTYSNNNSINGKFKTNKTKFLKDNFYEVTIEFEIKINNTVNLYKKIIESIIVHELNHAFVYIKKLNKKNKSNILNQTQNFTKKELNSLRVNNPQIKEFMNLIYLSLPEEVQARVQQTATELKNIDMKDYNDTIETLMQYNPINDAKYMMSYNVNEIKQIDKDVLKTFIGIFNSNIKMFSADNKIKSPNDTNSFFEYWGK